MTHNIKKNAAMFTVFKKKLTSAFRNVKVLQEVPGMQEFIDWDPLGDHMQIVKAINTCDKKKLEKNKTRNDFDPVKAFNRDEEHRRKELETLETDLNKIDDGN